MINYLKNFNLLETLYFDLTQNAYVFSILKSFLSKYDILKLMKNAILKLDSCKIIDKDILNI